MHHLAKILLLPLVPALLLTACGSRSEPRLTFAVGGVPAELEVWEGLVREFEKSTGHTVELLRHPSDSDQRRQGLVVALKARQPDPDVFLMDVAWLGQFAASGWLAPVDSGWSPDTAAFFRKVLAEADVVGGVLMALPVYVDGGLLYYRKDLLKRYGFSGPPRTWGELVDQGMKVQAGERAGNPDFHAYAWQGAQYEGLVCNFLEVAASGGGGFNPSREALGIHGTENVKALRFLRDLIHRHRISPPSTYTEMKEEESRAFFQAGNALFLRNWPYAVSLLEADDSPVRGKVGIAPLPHFEGGRSASTLGGWHVGVSAYGDVMAQARELVRFLVSPEVQKRLAMDLGWNPGRTDLYADAELLAKRPHLAELRRVFENAVSRPNLPYYTGVSSILQRHVNDALADNLSPEAALEKARMEIGAAMERYESR